MLLKKFDFEVKPEELLSAQRQNKHLLLSPLCPVLREPGTPDTSPATLGPSSAGSPVPSIP